MHASEVACLLTASTARTIVNGNSHFTCCQCGRDLYKERRRSPDNTQLIPKQKPSGYTECTHMMYDCPIILLPLLATNVAADLRWAFRLMWFERGAQQQHVYSLRLPASSFVLSSQATPNLFLKQSLLCQVTQAIANLCFSEPLLCQLAQASANPLQRAIALPAHKHVAGWTPNP